MLSQTTIVSVLAGLAVAPSVLGASQYNLVQDYSGADFFQGFKYNESVIDYNNYGNVHFLGQSQALSSNLTYVNSNGRTVIKVDNTTNGQGDITFGRNSVYLMSEKTMTMGSLLVFDANHMPFGCSVWPALFTQGQKWPEQGEIDIIENVNQATKNQYSLHSGANSGSCVQPPSIFSSQTGLSQVSTPNTPNNCTVLPTTDQNTGCVVQDSSDGSFGAGFNSNGGGVYATLWNDDGIKMWFWERGSAEMPSGIGGKGALDPESWSMEPAAYFPASGCDPSKIFGPQIITLYIDICGAFAGNDQVFQSTCGSIAPNCSAMVPDPRNYDNAYWEINYLRVFSTSSSSSSSNSSTHSNSNTQSGSNSASASGTLFSSRAGNMLGLVSGLAMFFGVAALL
ncbi:hypothetical protein D9758_014017 [Tetrapyrgos nigripes]|uniref:GH16 domain-containing protein n=1 Tax=Tetrapyrgos nigripes TaxID=182062 RepID=A0A8H5CYU4_9AGAR|nr:hypothetical protein D9758_014017 [Tetrapyrgos nigripes]